MTRQARLKQLLLTHQREQRADVQGRIREGRRDQPHGSRDNVDTSDATFQQEIDMALLQMRASTLARIDEALARLDAGQYGLCSECDGTIAELRLRALPFAVRCRECEETREGQQSHARHVALRGFSPFSSLVG